MRSSVPDNSPIATDECGDVVVTLSETTQGEGCEQTIQRTWMATDQCGNTAHAQQTVVISDTDSPQITGQAEFAFSCNMGQIAIPVANDACGVVVSFEFADVFTGSGCEQILDRTWTAVDHCGNTSTFVQHIVVADTEAPVFTFIPADMTFACGETAKFFSCCRRQLQRC
ncbi:MAG: hypothetical protein IPP69_03990 [Flavobacteriales bacterium]|nr:hypothetical protein [Flavobacteriales bacterium]